MINLRYVALTLDLFDPTDGQPPIGITEANSVTGSPILSQDGGLLAAVGPSDNTMTLWNVRTPERPHVLATAPVLPGVQEINFDSNGKRVADNNNQTLELWDIANPTAPVHEATISFQSPGTNTPETIYSAGFTEPNGPLAVVANDSIILLDTSAEEIADQLCSEAITAITPEQWQKYSHGIPYQKPCG